MSLPASGAFSNARNNRRKLFAARFGLVGATLGFIAGLCEAAVLYTVPRPLVLLQPDIQYVIWFVAPMVGLTFFAALGLALGLMASVGSHLGQWKAAALAALGLGVAGVYVAAVMHLVHGGGKGPLGALWHAGPWACFLAVFVPALLVLGRWSHRARRFLDADIPWRLAPWRNALVLAAAVAVSGLAVSQLRRAVSWAFEPAASSLTRGSPPNIVLITLDTVRADHLSAYGYPRLTTPNIDRLALQGVLFEDAVAPTSWTLPSHSSIFTELLPHQHGANVYTPLHEGPWTLPQVLRSYGYETAGFNSNLGYGQTGWGLGRGFEVYEDQSSSLRHNFAATLIGRTLGKFLYYHLIRPDDLDRRDARQLNREVFRWFRQRTHRPFFLFINYYDTHDPYLPPAPYDRQFGRVSYALVRKVNALGSALVPRELSEEEQASLVAAYDNSLAFLDDQVGRLLQFLAATPTWSNTVVIITSDHGEAFGEHGLYTHGWDLYREVVHVPLIILGPGIPAGRRVTHTARIREIFSTVLDLASHGKLPFRRTSLGRFWTPNFEPEPFDEVAVSELVPVLPNPQRVLISLTKSQWHYLYDSSGHEELYHWPSDPLEKTNLAESPAQKQTIESLRGRLQEYVGLSLRPWRGPQYLFALDGPGYSFLRHTAFGLKLQSNLPPTLLRVGASQALFPAGPSSMPARPQPGDEELIESLPYH